MGRGITFVSFALLVLVWWNNKHRTYTPSQTRQLSNILQWRIQVQLLGIPGFLSKSIYLLGERFWIVSLPAPLATADMKPQLTSILSSCTLAFSLWRKVFQWCQLGSFFSIYWEALLIEGWIHHHLTSS